MASRQPSITPARPGPGRRRGARNPGYDERRRELAKSFLSAVVSHHGPPSLHELARVSDTSIPTIKHYFGDRAGAVAAALRSVQADAAPHLARVADPGRLGLGRSLHVAASDLVTAWVRFGVGAVFSAGMAAGLGEPSTGPAYLDGVLEPTVRAFEARLGVHASRGELDARPDDSASLRAAALAFVSPLLVALLHQEQLSGRACRPLDLRAFVDTHVRRFVRAWSR